MSKLLILAAAAQMIALAGYCTQARASMIQDAAVSKQHTFYLDSRNETVISKRDALKGLLLNENHAGVYKCTLQIVSERATLVNAKKPKK